MRCSCRSRCSCENKCVCHPDRCLCLPCYQLRGSRCQLCGLFSVSKTFTSLTEEAIDFCMCFYVPSQVISQDELPLYKNRGIDDSSEFAEDLRNIFAESYDDSRNLRNGFRPIASSTASSQSEVSEQVANSTKTREGSNYLCIRDIQNIRKDALTENLPLVTIEEEKNTFEILKTMHPSTTWQASNIARKGKLEISPRKRNCSQRLNHVTKDMQEKKEVLNVVFPRKRVNIECGSDSTSVSNPASLSSSGVPISVTKQSNIHTKICFSKQCDSRASSLVSSGSKVHNSHVSPSVSSTIPISPLTKLKIADTNTETMPHSTSVSSQASLPSSDVSIYVTKQINTHTKTCFSKPWDSGASFSASSPSKVHNSYMPPSVSSTTPINPWAKLKIAGTNTETAPYSSAISKKVDSVEVPLGFLNYYEYFPTVPLEYNSAVPTTIEAPFYQHLRITPDITENTTAQGQTHSLTIHDSPSRLFTSFSNTLEDPNTSLLTFEAPFYHNRILPEPVIVTGHNQYLIPQSYNSQFCITPNVIFSPTPISLTPVPLRTTPPPPYPSSTVLRSETSE